MIIDAISGVDVRIETSSHIEASSIMREFESHINFEVSNAIQQLLPDTLLPNTLYVFIQDNKLSLVGGDDEGYLMHIHGPRGLLRFMRNRFTICATKTALTHIQDKTRYLRSILLRHDYKVWDIANGKVT